MPWYVPSWRPEGWNPDWRNGPGTPEEQVRREHRLQWNLMLKYGLQPGRDAECFAIFRARDQGHAERVAPALRQQGVTSVKVRSHRGRLTRRITWWVDGIVTIPKITLEAMDLAGLALLGQAQELGCWFIGLCPVPQP